MIIRSGEVTAGNTEITNIKKTSDLTTGMFVYGLGIPICTKILSIDESSKKIELDKEPTQGTGSFVALQFTSANPGVYVERCEALKDIKSIIDERGDYVKITIRSEGDISRDSYKSIEKKERITEIFLKSYPIEIRPSEKQLEKAGIREKSDITIWTAMYDWMSYGIDFNDIEFANRSTVTWQNNIYDIKDKGLVSQVGDSFLYLTLGLVKR